jgi:hypothetical protein
MHNYRRYTDAEAASLYSVLNSWGASDEFYLSLVSSGRIA